MMDFDSFRKNGLYQAYSYSYPHKSAYRELEVPLALKDVWRDEKLDSLALYFHVPFCEMRCGFCNLFTFARPRTETIRRYLDSMERQVSVCSELQASFARIAIGGGTPTSLDCATLEKLFDLKNMLAGQEKLPLSIEVSPDTVDREKMALLGDGGVTRVSIGIQSFLENETAEMLRPQSTPTVHRALEVIRARRFEILNIDLIYGASNQSIDSWLFSLEEALRYDPEELFLYPLYVRPLTGLGKGESASGDRDQHRFRLYIAGRDYLLANGYRQNSMRMFTKVSCVDTGPSYCCQTDGMLGIGCGARSYTSRVHYSSRYAVKRQKVADIISEYSSRNAADHASIQYGFVLDAEDQKRRFVIQSILNVEGLDVSQYHARFQANAFEDFPVIEDLRERGLVAVTPGRVVLTGDGLALSDVIGPWLISERVRGKMEAYLPV